jgi:hypothetical protein
MTLIIGIVKKIIRVAINKERRLSHTKSSVRAAICVAQFIKQPNHKEKLKELGELSSWRRAEFIEKGGWDKMPGQEKAGYLVSRACADGLELLFEK